MPDDAHAISEAQLTTVARELRSAAAGYKELVRRQDRIAALACLAVPVILVSAKLAWPPIAPIAVLYAIGVLLAYVLGADRSRGNHLKASARARESHDCQVLDLAWSRRAAGEEPDDGETKRWAAAASAAKGPGSGGGDPFPREVDQLPLTYGRLACQSLTLYWEPTAVERYLKALGIGASVLIALLLVTGLVLRPGAEAVTSTLLGLSPVVFWVWREQRRWREAGRRASRVTERLNSAWRSAIAKTIQEGALPSLARGIQDDIYGFRLHQPVIPGWAAKRYWQRLSYDARRIDGFVDEYRADR